MEPTLQTELGRLAQDLQLRRRQVESVVELLDSGCTPQQIVRYRKEQTGALNEELVQTIQRRALQIRQLEERKATVLKWAEVQGRLTDAVRTAIDAATTPVQVEDLALPFKPRKHSIAAQARDRGLEPLADAVWEQSEALGEINETLAAVVDPDKGLTTVEEVLAGLQTLFAERIAENAEIRAAIRPVVWNGLITTSLASPDAPQGGEPQAGGRPSPNHDYRGFAEFAEPIRQIASQKILGINRGERQGVVNVALDYDRQQVENLVRQAPVLINHKHRTLLEPAAGMALDILDSQFTREVRGELTDFAEDQAVRIIAKTVQNLLMQAGVAGEKVLAIDPGLKTGCKFAVLDEKGNVLEHAVVFPFTARRKRKKKKNVPLATETATSLQAALWLAQIEEAEKGATAAPSAQEPTHAAPAESVHVSHANGEIAYKEAHPPENAVIKSEPPIMPADSFYRSTSPGDGPELTDDYTSAGSAVSAPPPPTNHPSTEHPKGETTTGEQPPNASQSTEPSPAETLAGEQSFPEYAMPDQHGAEVLTEPQSGASGEPTMQHDSANAAAGDNPAPAHHDGGVNALHPNPTVPWTEGTESTPDATFAGEEEGGATEGEEDDEDESPQPRRAGGPPQPPRRERAKQLFAELCKTHDIRSVALGNGPACREIEELLAEIIKDGAAQIRYTLVPEAAAIAYASSVVGREEFPERDADARAAISLGRRLQDPLKELVKIDPQSVGIGNQHHDVSPRLLKERLQEVVESCVNQVGVDLNAADASLLQHVSGLNPLRAKMVVDYRAANGPFRDREQLKKVVGVTEMVYAQAAGFVRIYGGDQPLDETWIHPESYGIAHKILEQLGVRAEMLRDPVAWQAVVPRLDALNAEQLAQQLGSDVPTVWDVLEFLARPKRDPRAEYPQPVFKTGILQLENLAEGMELTGTVLNVVDFGVFLDVGLKDSGLVHLSQMANRFVRSPYELVTVGDVLKVWVLNVDLERRRVSLTMISPEARRGPQEQRPRRPRGMDRGGEGGQQQRPQEGGGQQQGGQQHGGQQQGGQNDFRGNQDRGQRSPPRDGGRRGGRSDQRPRDRDRDQDRERSTEYVAKPKPRPLPELSQEALEGKGVLHGFGELKAFFEAKKPRGHDEKPPKQENG